MEKMPLVHMFTKFSHQNLKCLLCTKLPSLRKTVTLASVLKLCPLEPAGWTVWTSCHPSLLLYSLLSIYIFYSLPCSHISTRNKRKQSCQFVQIDSQDHLGFTSSIRIVLEPQFYLYQNKLSA